MSKNRSLLLVAAALLISGAGVVHGFWTNRWNTSTAIKQMGERVAGVPVKVGDWVGTTAEFNPRELELAGATCSLVRTYQNQTNGERVSVFLIGGLPSHIASHTPDVCYPGAGFVMGEAAEQTIPCEGSTAILRTAEATREEPGGSSHLRIYWGWDDGQGWKAPEDARKVFVGSPALCKLYVVKVKDASQTTDQESSVETLLHGLLPQIHETLFSEARTN